MAQFAKIEKGIVIDVIEVDEAYKSNAGEFLLSIGISGTFIESSPDGEFRLLPATIGGTYDVNKDCFYPPRPYPSWIWNDEKIGWVAPIDVPVDENSYYWDEEDGIWTTFSWTEVTE